jgi:transcriptional regulator with XRE-family HTH domain
MALNHHWDGLPLTPPVLPTPTEKKLSTRGFHRIADARKRQGLSLRAVAKRLERDVQELRAQERPDYDLRLSDLYRWHAILDVPISELLDEPDMSSLSPPVMKRAQLLKIMKTVKAILESTADESVGRMAESLVAQLTEIMPELANVPAWPAVGQRRTLDEYGRTASALVSRELFGRERTE